MDLGVVVFHNVTDWCIGRWFPAQYLGNVVVEDAPMELSDTQVFVAMVVALLPLAMAVRLGLALYK